MTTRRQICFEKIVPVTVETFRCQIEKKEDKKFQTKKTKAKISKDVFTKYKSY